MSEGSELTHWLAYRALYLTSRRCFRKSTGAGILGERKQAWKASVVRAVESENPFLAQRSPWVLTLQAGTGSFVVVYLFGGRWIRAWL